MKRKRTSRGLAGSPNEHAARADAAIDDALGKIKEGACFRGAMALGAASAHIEESRLPGTRLLHKWDKASTAFIRACEVRPRSAPLGGARARRRRR